MNTTTNTTKKTKRPYRKTGEFSRKPNLSERGVYRVTEAANLLLNMTKNERQVVLNLFH